MTVVRSREVVWLLMNELSTSVADLVDVIWVLAESAEFSCVDENESYIMDVETKSLFSLNGAGTLVARQLQRGAKSSDLVELMRATFGIEQQQSEQDLAVFLEELHRRGLVRPKEW